MSQIAPKEMDEAARQIWLSNNLAEQIEYQEEMWTDYEFDPAFGTISFGDWEFSKNENSDKVTYTHQGFEGEFWV